MNEKVEKGYHKLIIWEKFKELLLLTYSLLGKLPQSEEMGLKSQMRRAVVSVLSNFVEGYLKRSNKEKLKFLETSESSLLELEAQSEICHMLNYWNTSDYETFENKRKLAGYFLFKYKSKLIPPTTP